MPSEKKKVKAVKAEKAWAVVINGRMSWDFYTRKADADHHAKEDVEADAYAVQVEITPIPATGRRKK